MGGRGVDKEDKNKKDKKREMKKKKKPEKENERKIKKLPTNWQLKGMMKCQSIFSCKSPDFFFFMYVMNETSK